MKSENEKLEFLIQDKINEYVYPEFEFIPLQIIFKLGSPVMLTYPWISFDGLMSHLMAEEILDDVFRLIPARIPFDIISKIWIPLKKSSFINGNNMNDWIFHASVSQFSDNDAISTQTLRRAFNSEKCVRETIPSKNKIDIVRGHFKLYSMELPVNYSKFCVFYCMGDKNIISKLCNRITHLGKHRAIGSGNVLNFKINVIEDDRSMLYNERIMRPLPEDYCKYKNLNFENKKKAFLSYKAPYWDKEKFRMCFIPEV